MSSFFSEPHLLWGLTKTARAAAHAELLPAVAFAGGGAAGIPEVELNANTIAARTVPSAVTSASVAAVGLTNDLAAAAVSDASPVDPRADAAATSARGDPHDDRWTAAAAVEADASLLAKTDLAALSDSAVVSVSGDRALVSHTAADVGSDASTRVASLAELRAAVDLDGTDLQDAANLDVGQVSDQSSTNSSAWREDLVALAASAARHTALVADLAHAAATTASSLSKTFAHLLRANIDAWTFARGPHELGAFQALASAVSALPGHADESIADLQSTAAAASTDAPVNLLLLAGLAAVSDEQNAFRSPGASVSPAFNFPESPGSDSLKDASALTFLAWLAWFAWFAWFAWLAWLTWLTWLAWFAWLR